MERTLDALLAFTRFARPLDRGARLCTDCLDARIREELASQSWGLPEDAADGGNGG